MLHQYRTELLGIFIQLTHLLSIYTFSARSFIHQNNLLCETWILIYGQKTPRLYSSQNSYFLHFLSLFPDLFTCTEVRGGRRVGPVPIGSAWGNFGSLQQFFANLGVVVTGFAKSNILCPWPSESWMWVKVFQGNTGFSNTGLTYWLSTLSTCWRVRHHRSFQAFPKRSWQRWQQKKTKHLGLDRAERNTIFYLVSVNYSKCQSCF